MDIVGNLGIHANINTVNVVNKNVSLGLDAKQGTCGFIRNICRFFSILLAKRKAVGT